MEVKPTALGKVASPDRGWRRIRQERMQRRVRAYMSCARASTALLSYFPDLFQLVTPRRHVSKTRWIALQTQDMKIFFASLSHSPPMWT